MKDNKISLTIFLLIAFLITGMLGFSYAYFKPNVIGSGKTNVAVSGDLRLNFNDEMSLSQSAIYPGDSFTKTFTVSNSGAETLGYAIDWEQYNNTFINGEIHISLTCLSYINYDTEQEEISGECEGVEEREATEDPLKEGVEISSGITHEYEIRITFIETGENQDYNKGKIFNATLKVVDNVALVLNLGGGETEQTFKSGYEPGQTIELTNPEKETHTFLGWSVTGMGSSIEGNILTVGARNTTVTATWKIYPLLTVNLNGGNTTQTFSERYAPNSILSLITPIKNGYVQNEWIVSGTGASINGSSLTMGTENTTLTANYLTFEEIYSYTGNSTIINDGNGNWRIKFLTSGTFTSHMNKLIDVFLVGGGGGGFYGGGGGGYTTTVTNISLSKENQYNIVVGLGGAAQVNGGTTTAFGNSALGGYASSTYNGGNGGSGGATFGSGTTGGAGGSNGTNGQSVGGYTAGAGQVTITREFEEATGTLYSGGGGGGGNYGGAGGAGGGASGTNSPTPAAASANTGGGGGGQNKVTTGGGAGGSGIVIIRKHN